MDLVQFLRDRYDDEARIAGAATPGPWKWTPEEDVWGHCGPTLIRAGYDGEGGRELVEVLSGWGHDAWGMEVTTEDRTHIARHDPARVLADVDAKRQAVAKCAQLLSYGPVGDTEVDRAGDGAYVDAAETMLRLLALPYADHPDYRDEWRP